MYRTYGLLLPIALAGALLLSTPAGAGQASTSFVVTTTIGVACTLSASDLFFGQYTGIALSGQTEISIGCSDGVPLGSLMLTTPTGFEMISPTTFQNVPYNLYRDAAHTQQIIAGQAFSVGPSDPQPISIFGEIPAGPVPSNGTYSDTVSVVFNF